MLSSQTQLSLAQDFVKLLRVFFKLIFYIDFHSLVDYNSYFLELNKFQILICNETV